MLWVELWVAHIRQHGIHIRRGFAADICRTLSPPVNLSQAVPPILSESRKPLLGRASWGVDLLASFPCCLTFVPLVVGRVGGRERALMGSFLRLLNPLQMAREVDRGYYADGGSHPERFSLVVDFPISTSRVLP